MVYFRNVFEFEKFESILMISYDDVYNKKLQDIVHLELILLPKMKEIKQKVNMILLLMAAKKLAVKHQAVNLSRIAHGKVVAI